MYMGGGTDGVSAVLTAGSPQQLIDQLSVQDVMATEMATQMTNFRAANEQAIKAAEASAKSAAEARTAAERAAAVRAELQAKQSRLQTQIAAVQAQYEVLTPDQRSALADPGPPHPVPPATDPAIIAMPGEPPADAAPPAVDAPPGAAPGGDGGTVVQAALTRVGSPYSWGAAGPNAFDCSGLIMWAFQQTGKLLPHSSQALAAGGQPVALSELRDVLLGCLTRGHLYRRRDDGAFVDVRHPGSGGSHLVDADSQRSSVLTRIGLRLHVFRTCERTGRD
jgi:peptidoglycan DL-endopeptidase CwlO